ncbi:hypothetical protein vBKpnAMK6_00019 [Klebsiella phage vB_Kpn_AM_K6]
MVKASLLRFTPGVGLQYKIVGGHKFQYFTPGRLYFVELHDSRAGYKVRSDANEGIWVSFTQVKRWFTVEGYNDYE